MMARMTCSKCGKDITFVGSQICEICDPDVEELLRRGQASKSPTLCSVCFEKHMMEHGAEEWRKSQQAPCAEGITTINP